MTATAPVTQVKIIGVDFYGNANSNNETTFGSQDITVYNINGMTIQDCLLTSDMSGSFQYPRRELNRRHHRGQLDQ